jgi:hypothetical protein
MLHGDKYGVILGQIFLNSLLLKMYEHNNCEISVVNSLCSFYKMHLKSNVTIILKIEEYKL